MTPTVWQKLGAFVHVGENLANEQLDAFAKIGGAWVVVLVYNDATVVPKNLELLPSIQKRCRDRGITVGGWFNGIGGPATFDANPIAQLVHRYGLKLTMLDLEGPYQWPGGNPGLMPELVMAVRALIGPAAHLAVSTNGMNNASIWNGRTLNPPRSFYDLGVRVIPQWYDWMWKRNTADHPATQMKWLKDNGATDGNFADKTGYKGQGLPRSYVHGTVEFTGIEDAVMADELTACSQAIPFGLTPGLSLYVLDRANPDDWPLIAATRGHLYL